MIPTEDYTTWINAVDTNTNTIFYENKDGKKWKITGVCNQCGLCENYQLPVTVGVPYIEPLIRVDSQNQLTQVNRLLQWNDQPGQPGAHIDLNYQTRQDMPVTPDLIVGCVLTGEWL